MSRDPDDSMRAQMLHIPTMTASARPSASPSARPAALAGHRFR